MANETVNAVLPADGYMTGSEVKALDPVMTGNAGLLTNDMNWGRLRYQTKGRLFTVVLDYPRGFDYLPNPDRWIGLFKSIWEDMAVLKEGFNWTRTPTWAESEHGSTGDMHHQMTDIRFTPTEPMTQIKEREGYVIEKFVYGWWEYLNMDVVSKRPGVFDLPDVNKEDIVLSSDFSGGVLCAFEASECLRYIHKAQIVYNVEPKDGIESTGIFDQNAEKPVVEHSLMWTGTAVRDRGAEDVARTLLQRLTANSLSSSNRRAIIADVNERVKAVKAGLQANVDEVAAMQR